MSENNKSLKQVFFLYFSSAMESFYGQEVETITTFDYRKVGLKTQGYKKCHIDFMADDPGYATLLSVPGDHPVFEIAILGHDLVLQMFWYEFEIIRPFLVTSMTDLVNHYRFLLKHLARYQSGEFKLNTNAFYLKFLQNILPLLQNAIEVIAVTFVDKKKQKSNGGVEGLIEVDLEDRFPFVRGINSVNEKLVKNILLN